MNIFSPRNYLTVDWPGAFCNLPKPMFRLAPVPGQVCVDDCQLDLRPEIKRMGWEAFLPEVMFGTRMDAESITDDIAASYIRSAAIEFAEKTHALQREIRLDVECCVKDYRLATDDNERIVGVHAVCTADGCVQPKDDECCEWGGMRFRFHAPDIIVFDEPPRSACCDVARVIVSVTPRQDACHVDAFLYEFFREAVEQGAIARLLSNSKFENVAARRKEEFMRSMSEAKRRVSLSFAFMGRQRSDPVISQGQYLDPLQLRIEKRFRQVVCDPCAPPPCEPCGDPVVSFGSGTC